MKLTRQQLSNFINEEINLMIENGELDEGFLDALRAGGSKLGKDIGGAFKSAPAGIEKIATGIKKSAEAAQTAATTYANNLITAAKEASTKADTAKVLQTTEESIKSTLKVLEELDKKSPQLKLGDELKPMIRSLNQVIRKIYIARESLGFTSSTPKTKALPPAPDINKDDGESNLSTDKDTPSPRSKAGEIDIHSKSKKSI